MLSNHRLGKRVPKAPGGDLAPGPPSQVEELKLELGQETVACSAQVVGKSPSLSSLVGDKGRGFRVSAHNPKMLRSAILLFSISGVDWEGKGPEFRRASVVTDAISFSDGSCRCGEP